MQHLCMCTRSCSSLGLGSFFSSSQLFLLIFQYVLFSEFPPVALFIFFNACSAKVSRCKNLSSATTVHQPYHPGARTRKFTHLTCILLFLKLFSTTLLSRDGDPSSPCLQGSCFSYHINLYLFSLRNFPLQFLSFSSPTV